MAAKKATGATKVEAIVHGDKRSNIPTADAQEWIAPELEQPKRLRWERDPSLDPQLVWKGKDDNADLLEVDAPPVYIQEKIDPRVLIENLRQTARSGESEPELTLFDSFDGLNELDIVDFYRHQSNWSNRMILGDSLQVMASLAERENLRGKVQMIYLDPPYGIKFGSNWQMSTRKRDVKDGKLEDATFEVEQIKAFRDTWELGIHSYLQYLRDRLMVARDLLTESGSIFVQIGDENVHRVRALLDEVFGSENFFGQLVVKTRSGIGTDVSLPSVENYVIWYAKDKEKVRYRAAYRPKTGGASSDSGQYAWIELSDGSRRRATQQELQNPPAEARFFNSAGLISATPSATTQFEVVFEGKVFRPNNGRGWSTNREGMQRLLAAGRVLRSGDNIRYLRYYDDFPVSPVHNIWMDTETGSFTDPKVYVVQTSSKVIQRCMLMCTDPGDLVLDPTCGSGTTAFVAEQWGRRWITVDTSRVALALARQRLMGGRFPYFLLADSPEGRAKEQQLTGRPLPMTDCTGDIRQGFVYERVQHVTLRSIANNPDIREGMSRQEIDSAIKRHADFELLYDKPYEDNKKVRVTGPFTVESLSPHRSLAFAGQGPNATETRSEAAAALESGAGFEEMIIANLAKAGIQNGRRNERLSFASVESYPGVYVQAVGEQSAGEGQPAKRIGICIGPQYGTVGPAIIKNAAKEALRASDIDLLVVLAFAFDPQALGADADYLSTDEGFADVQAERSLGRLPVLLVRMNNDLVMGADLKKTGSGNLFTVFGEPDIELRVDGDEVTIEVLGVDVYDPSTGEVRSRDTERIALWMLDTNYNEESFFVRHCYFTGGNDPYARLKRALKADIDEEAWSSLYSTVSRPFPRPETGKVAVKIINDYGDEVMKVFEA